MKIGAEIINNQSYAGGTSLIAQAMKGLQNP